MSVGRPAKHYTIPVSMCQELQPGKAIYFKISKQGGLIKRLREALDKDDFRVKKMRAGVAVYRQPVWDTQYIDLEAK